MPSGSQLMLAAAALQAAPPAAAVQIFNSKAFGDDIDAKFWRSQAEADSNDYPSARRDVIASLPVIGSYPQWLRTRFLLSGVRAALETGDTALAEQLYK